ncbi:LOW QUALITY PROTEIN: diterpene geranyllinalool synthase [Cinnamomum micranthum f. kanehirae]|uniref:Diterpene geranyllinalool synthase n=1 Tax=Cinnamomum micranthum f. kanehirae TaxID=337451 RepID=A0A3S3Q1I3_9MAGN|nr:LOW QUALITY PROTEIN: diterpene geranyllinalool synthase [Cinnamomum micranthum f. kanehirae]
MSLGGVGTRGLREIGFGREKSTYCYLSVASNAYHPSLSDVRMLVLQECNPFADDFFDMEGSLDELNTLTEAVGRWDEDGLSGHSKVIFDALDELVIILSKCCLIAIRLIQRRFVRELWYETFVSWLKGSKLEQKTICSIY